MDLSTDLPDFGEEWVGVYQSIKIKVGQMRSRISKTRDRQIYEWTRGLIGNIGTVVPLPYDIVFNYIREKNIYDIVRLFFDNSTKRINLLDLCIFEQFWWVDPTIIGARYSKVDHPTHYSGEYIFDKSNRERAIIEIRQPDIDGKHWVADHIHIKRGIIDSSNVLKIVKPTFNEHIELTSTIIQGVYIMRGPVPPPDGKE